MRWLLIVLALSVAGCADIQREFEPLPPPPVIVGADRISDGVVAEEVKNCVAACVHGERLCRPLCACALREYQSRATLTEYTSLLVRQRDRALTREDKSFIRKISAKCSTQTAP